MLSGSWPVVNPTFSSKRSISCPTIPDSSQSKRFICEVSKEAMHHSVSFCGQVTASLTHDPPPKGTNTTFNSFTNFNHFVMVYRPKHHVRDSLVSFIVSIENWDENKWMSSMFSILLSCYLIILCGIVMLNYLLIINYWNHWKQQATIF